MEKKTYETPELGVIVLSDELMVDIEIVSGEGNGEFDAKGDMGTWDDEDWVNDNE